VFLPERLFNACQKGDVKTVMNIISKDKSLLNEGLDEYGQGWTALCTACAENHLSLVSHLLVQESIDVNKGKKV
jgi:ankyrin repeat protein